MERIEVKRKTTESEMSVVLDFSSLKTNYRENIDTGITFLNHMIEHIAWRSGVNVECNVKLDKFQLSHVICEDLGIALGKAVAEYIKRMADKGIMGYGDAYAIIDEARAHSLLSFEERSYFSLEYNGVDMTDMVEGMYKEDLETFLLGFSQGANCTLQISLEKGENGHHIWEAIFRSFGQAIFETFKTNPLRVGKTAGVAGKIEWIVD